MNPFTFNTAKSIINQPGAIKRLATVCHWNHIRRPLIVTDQGIVDNNLLAPAIEGLLKARVSVITFADVQADPSEDTVLKALRQAKSENIDGVIGFGGGSSLDTAKLVALMAGSGESLNEIYGVDKAKGPRLPLIQIPTTSGTGSEVTPIAIVTTGKSVKTGVVTPHLLPDIAILDAELTLGLPPHITAATGIDAMVHAIEAYTSAQKKNPYSDMLAREALRLMSGAITTAVTQGDNLEARQNMLLGACLAGQAFANAPVAAVHALAYPLGGHYHIPHGLSNALVLPHVMRFNAQETLAATQYAELAPLIMQGLVKSTVTSTEAAAISAELIAYLENLTAELGLPTNLRSVDIQENDIAMLAESAMQQQRLLVNNPRDLNYEDALNIYKAAY